MSEQVMPFAPSRLGRKRWVVVAPFDRETHAIRKRSPMKHEHIIQLGANRYRCISHPTRLCGDAIQMVKTYRDRTSP